MLPRTCHPSLLRGSKRAHPCRSAKSGMQRFGGEGSCCTKMQKKKPQGCGFLNCGTTGIRTWDTRIFNPLLYQLSYGTRKRCANIRHICLSSFEGQEESRLWKDDERLRANRSIQRHLQSLSFHSPNLRGPSRRFLPRVYMSSSTCDLHVCMVPDVKYYVT